MMEACIAYAPASPHASTASLVPLDADRGKRTSGGFFLPTQMLLIGGLALLLTVGFGAYFKGKEHGLREYYDYKAKITAQFEELEKEHEQRKLVSERITADVSHAWATSLDWYKRNPRTVRVHADSCPTGLRPLPAPTFGPVERPIEPGLGASADVAISVEECEARVNNAVLDAAQVLHLVDWIKQQAEVGR